MNIESIAYTIGFLVIMAACISLFVKIGEKVYAYVMRGDKRRHVKEELRLS